jgi:hypothetical protein
MLAIFHAPCDAQRYFLGNAGQTGLKSTVSQDGRAVGPERRLRQRHAVGRVLLLQPASTAPQRNAHQVL